MLSKKEQKVLDEMETFEESRSVYHASPSGSELKERAREKMLENYFEEEREANIAYWRERKRRRRQRMKNKVLSVMENIAFFLLGVFVTVAFVAWVILS